MTLAVLLVDHGSRRESAHKELTEAGDQLSSLLHEMGHHVLVEIAHMEIAPPSIAEAIARCATRGATVVRVLPCFLSRGRHVVEDVPRLVKEAAAEHPGLTVVMSPPLLDLPGFISMLAEHVTLAMDLSPAPDEPTN